MEYKGKKRVRGRKMVIKRDTKREAGQKKKSIKGRKMDKRKIKVDERGPRCSKLPIDMQSQKKKRNGDRCTKERKKQEDEVRSVIKRDR